MKLTPAKAKLGYVLLGVALLLFFVYWWYLLEPLQDKLLEAGKTPNLVLTIARSCIFATAISFCTFVGMAMTALAWQKWTTEAELRIGDALESKSFWTWVGVWNGGFLLFSLLWKYGNF